MEEEKSGLKGEEGAFQIANLKMQGGAAANVTLKHCMIFERHRIKSGATIDESASKSQAPRYNPKIPLTRKRATQL